MPVGRQYSVDLGDVVELVYLLIDLLTIFSLTVLRDVRAERA